MIAAFLVAGQRLPSGSWVLLLGRGRVELVHDRDDRDETCTCQACWTALLYCDQTSSHSARSGIEDLDAARLTGTPAHCFTLLHTELHIGVLQYTA